MEHFNIEDAQKKAMKLQEERTQAAEENKATFLAALKREFDVLVSQNRITAEEAEKELGLAAQSDVSAFENPLFEARALALHGRATPEEDRALQAWKDHLKPQRPSQV